MTSRGARLKPAPVKAKRARAAVLIRTIPPRADNYAQAMGVQYRDILISNMKYRWGSCTPANNLSFNWRLVKAPMHVIDYVVVHELAHLLEHNHSPRFWQHVKTQIPHFEACKAWLKDHGQCLEDELDTDN